MFKLLQTLALASSFAMSHAAPAINGTSSHLDQRADHKMQITVYSGAACSGSATVIYTDVSNQYCFTNAGGMSVGDYSGNCETPVITLVNNANDCTTGYVREVHPNSAGDSTCSDASFAAVHFTCY